MPINLNRDENIERQLSRLSYGQGLDIKSEVKNFLYTHPSHYYTADELTARLQTAAAAVQIESVLSHHPETFTHEKKNGKVYWQLTSEAIQR